jgi:hypothetical protein
MAEALQAGALGGIGKADALACAALKQGAASAQGLAPQPATGTAWTATTPC